MNPDEKREYNRLYAIANKERIVARRSRCAGRNMTAAIACRDARASTTLLATAAPLLGVPMVAGEGKPK
jgi:hypothetical protein